MAYFIDEVTHKIVYRQHSINTEVLNGDITEVSDHHSCFIMAHTPNKKLGYDLRVLEETTPEEGTVKVKKLGTKETAQKGQPYYELISAEKLNEYASDPDFTLILGEAQPQTDNQTTKAIENEQPVEIGKRVRETENIDNGTRRTKYKTTLVRDVRGERPINTRF